MEIIYVGKKNPSNRALLISNEEWKRLGKILTKKMDDEDEAKASKRLKDVRREMSKKMVDGWDNTELVSVFHETPFTSLNRIKLVYQTDEYSRFTQK